MRAILGPKDRVDRERPWMFAWNQRTSKNIPRLQMSAQFGLAEVSKKPAVAFHRNLMFEDLQRLP